MSSTHYINKLYLQLHGDSYGLKTGLSVTAVDGVLLDVDDRPVDIRLLATVARLRRPTTYH